MSEGLSWLFEAWGSAQHSYLACPPTPQAAHNPPMGGQGPQTPAQVPPLAHAAPALPIAHTSSATGVPTMGAPTQVPIHSTTPPVNPLPPPTGLSMGNNAPPAFFYRAQKFSSRGAPVSGVNWWCDAFGPYQLEGQNGWRGVGPFLMRPDLASKPNVLCCSKSRRKVNPCTARVNLKPDGALLRRRYFHNHPPEPQMPQPQEGELHLPPVPTFEEVAAIVATTRTLRVSKAEPELPQTIRVWNENKTEMVEIAVTVENRQDIADKAQVVEVNGKKVMHCPVVSCPRSLANRAALHQHLFTHIQGNQKRGAAGLTDDKLCPLCRAEQSSHEGLVRHIVDMHNTRLECTEHEFETMSDFQQWKRRTEQEDLSSFELGRWGKSHFCCCRAGRVEPGKHVNVRRTRLGFECPAAMVVRTDKAQGQPSRVRVTYWRTHLGHTPSVLDVRILKEQREWIVSLLEAGHTNRSIVAQGASRYFGPPLNKIHMLTERYLRRLASELQARTDKPIGSGTVDVPKSYEYGNPDQLRLALADMIHEGLNQEADKSGRVENDKDSGIHRHDEKILGGYGVLEHGRSGRYQVVKHRYEHIKSDRQQQSVTCVVFPRKAAHAFCDKICPVCQVCIHRYGCTCSAYMLHDRMCVHIHRIASLKGNPSEDYVRPDLIKEDTVGLPEALRRLQTLNHREKMKPLLPLADELFDLIKANRTVHPDQVEAFLRQGLAMMHASPQLQETRDDEAQLGPQPIDSAEARRYLRCKHPDNRSYNVISSNWDRNCLIVGVEPGTAKVKDEPADVDSKPPRLPVPNNKEELRQAPPVKSVVVKMSGPLSKTSQQARLNSPVASRKRGQGLEPDTSPAKKAKFTSFPGSVPGLAGRQAMARRGKDKVVLMKSKRIVVVKPDSLGVRPSGPFSTGPTLSYSYASSTSTSVTRPKTSKRQNVLSKKEAWPKAAPLPVDQDQLQADSVVIRPNDLGMSQDPARGPPPQTTSTDPTLHDSGVDHLPFAQVFNQRPHPSVSPEMQPLQPKQEPIDTTGDEGDPHAKDPTFTLTQL